jgi:two-component system, sensor histidine kinase ChiS
MIANFTVSMKEITMFKRLFSNRKGSSYSVLIVDDDFSVASMLENILHEEGYAVLVARGGEEALKILDDGAKPDTIILDLMMPHMTGQQFLEKARIRYGRAALAPVLLLTGSQNAAVIADGAGVDDMLYKPVDSQKLVQQIDKLIEKRAKSA